MRHQIPRMIAIAVLLVCAMAGCNASSNRDLARRVESLEAACDTLAKQPTPAACGCCQACNPDKVCPVLCGHCDLRGYNFFLSVATEGTEGTEEERNACCRRPESRVVERCGGDCDLDACKSPTVDACEKPGSCKTTKRDACKACTNQTTQGCHRWTMFRRRRSN